MYDEAGFEGLKACKCTGEQKEAFSEFFDDDGPDAKRARYDDDPMSMACVRGCCGPPPPNRYANGLPNPYAFLSQYVPGQGIFKAVYKLQ